MESVLVSGVGTRVSDRPSTSLTISSRFSYGRGVKSNPSRYMASKTNARSGTLRANFSMFSFRRLEVVSWKGTYSSDSGL